MRSKNAVVYLLLVLSTGMACQSEKPDKPQLPVPAISTQPVEDSSKVILRKPIEEVLVPDYDTSQWTDIALLDNSIVLDLKYASTDNFVDEQLYDCPRCFLRPEVAKVLVRLHAELKPKGYGIKLFDCYRPLSVQKRLWEKIPDATYVTNPKKGSMHNRGLAVDLTLVDVDGAEVDMGTPFDFFGRKAHHTHTELPEEVLAHRRLLKSTMEAAGFRAIRTEWWHYSYKKARYAIDDMIWTCE